MYRRLAVFTVILSLPLACRGSVEPSETDDGSGGVEVAETGGSLTGGAPATAGTDGLGGGPWASGGAAASGGHSMGGSVPSTGGGSGTGGAATSGGTTTAGGATAGGATPTGGAQDTGGNHNDGGVHSGGAPNTGGTPSPGGASNTGGTIHAGGDPGGQLRFVGNITTRHQVNPGELNFADYWDQITPENAGKWGSVQSSPGASYNWNTLDAIYDYAQENEILFKEHTLIWGSSPPSGVTTQDHVIDWIRSFCERYPDTALIDVVNEPPPHTSVYFENVMADSNDGEWQWITNAFIWARQYCPDAVLILNDYNNIEWDNDNERFIEIVNTIVADGAPIDAVGAETHLRPGSSSDAPPPEEVARLLNKLHDETGLPVYITELDFAGLDDQEQLEAYQVYFPMFRQAEFVPGITLWGWIVGATWLDNSGLVRDGVPRPAMTWLMNELDRPVP